MGFSMGYTQIKHLWNAVDTNLHVVADETRASKGGWFERRGRDVRGCRIADWNIKPMLERDPLMRTCVQKLECWIYDCVNVFVWSVVIEPMVIKEVSRWWMYSFTLIKFLSYSMKIIIWEVKCENLNFCAVW